VTSVTSADDIQVRSVLKASRTESARRIAWAPRGGSVGLITELLIQTGTHAAQTHFDCRAS